MLDALTFDQIRTFVVVAEARSFRAAAAQLSRAQSAVSRAIGNLENVLGVQLFDRSTHRPTLTLEGRALLADARTVLQKVDFMRARAQGWGDGVELGLAIVIDTWFPLHVVTAALGDLREIYPSVAVRISTAPLGGPLLALRDGRCTLAITVSEDFRDSAIELEALSTVLVVTVAAAIHPLASRTEDAVVIGNAELADHLQVLLEDPSQLSADREFGVVSPVAWRVTEQETKLAVIRAGLCWGRLPQWVVERDLAEGRLVRIAAAAIGPKGEIVRNAYLARRSDMELGPAGRALREALIRRAGALS